MNPSTPFAYHEGKRDKSRINNLSRFQTRDLASRRGYLPPPVQSKQGCFKVKSHKWQWCFDFTGVLQVCHLSARSPSPMRCFDCTGVLQVRNPTANSREPGGCFDFTGLDPGQLEAGRPAWLRPRGVSSISPAREVLPPMAKIHPGARGASISRGCFKLTISVHSGRNPRGA